MSDAHQEMVQRFIDNATTKDWPDDFHLDNGNYMNTCSTCGSTFMGYKRRRTCRECFFKKD